MCYNIVIVGEESMNKHKISLWEVILFLLFALWAGGMYYLAVIGKYYSDIALNITAIIMVLTLLSLYIHNYNKRHKK